MWSIATTDRFDDWPSAQNDTDRACILAAIMVLEEKGPGLARPYADTVHGSRFSNMKELRVQSRGDPVRVFFAFNPSRTGVLLCAGNKVGNEKRFYDEMIPIADQEFTEYLNQFYDEE